MKSRKHMQHLSKSAKKILTTVVIVFLTLFNLANAQTELIYTGTKYNYEDRSYEVVTSLTLAPPFAFSATANKEFFATTDLVSQPNQGFWSDPNTWTWRNNQVPTANDVVTIPAGKTVKMAGSMRAKGIIVNGTLEAVKGQTDDSWIDLETEYILVQGVSAKLEIGTSAQPYISNEGAVITLIGTEPAWNQGNAVGGEANNDKVIMAMGGGTIELFGKEYLSWTKLDATAVAGATQITLDDPVDWEVGQEIVIASNTSDWEEAEEATITSISTNKKVLTLSQGLDNEHLAGEKDYQSGPKSWHADLRPEVGLLSRNIKIQGDDYSNQNGFGGHIMIMPGSIGKNANVELYQMGQRFRLKRYPWHWHLNGDATGEYMKNSAVHRSYNRAITVHGTNEVEVSNNVCYDHVGHGIFLEDGSEHDNVITFNVVLSTKKPANPADALLESDKIESGAQNQGPASFWITNPKNDIQHNIAAGSEGSGFWFAFTDQSKNEPLQAFAFNTAHSNVLGFDIFDHFSLASQADGVTTDDIGDLSNGGWNNSGEHKISNCLWYANELAVYTGTGTFNVPVNTPTDNLIFDNNVFVENETNVMFASYSIVNNSVFVAESDLNLIDESVSLYRVYDGAGQVHNSHLIGWDQPNAKLLRNTGAATKHTNNRFLGITMDHPLSDLNVVLNNFDLAPNSGIAQDNSDLHPRMWSIVVKDVDGTLTGTHSASLVSNHPFMLTKVDVEGEEVPVESKHASYDRAYISNHRFATAILDYDDFNQADQNLHRPDVVISRKDRNGIMQDEHIYEVYGTTAYRDHHQIPVIIDSEFEYVYNYVEKNPMEDFNNILLTLDDVTADAIAGNDEFVARFKHLGSLGYWSIAVNATRYYSYSDFDNASGSAYYIESGGDEDLLIKIVPSGKKQTLNITWPGTFLNAYNFSKIDSDGDFMDDTKELDLGRHPFDASDLEMEFENDGDFEGWDVYNNLSQALILHGRWIGTSSVTNLDAQIVNDNFNFKADRIDEISMQFVATKNVNVDLFFKTSTEDFYSESKKIRVSYTDAFLWRTLDFDVSANSKWRGTITGLRLDPVDKVDTYFEIFWIKANCIGSNCDPGASAARVAQTNELVLYDVKNSDENVRNKSILYPNPVKDLAEIDLSNYDHEVRLTLYDLLGNLQYDEMVKPEQNRTHVINFKDMSVGFYMLNITSKEGNKETIKLIVEKSD